MPEGERQAPRGATLVVAERLTTDLLVGQGVYPLHLYELTGKMVEVFVRS